MKLVGHAGDYSELILRPCRESATRMDFEMPKLFHPYMVPQHKRGPLRIRFDYELVAELLQKMLPEWPSNVVVRWSMFAYLCVWSAPEINPEMEGCLRRGGCCCCRR